MRTEQSEREESGRIGLNELRGFDYILVNSSAGKDSQAMLDYIVSQATLAGVLDRVLVVHADLGRVEWKGTADLAKAQADYYGLPFHKVSRIKGDLLDQIQARGMWPDSKNRYCTSDQKRDQIAKLINSLNVDGRPARVLNCMGLRAEESPARAKRPTVESNKRLSNSKRTVINWLPIHDWTTEQVWATIKASGCPHHFAYDLGMPRLSCVFCVFAPKAALMLAGKHNPELLDEYVATEDSIGHTFRKDFSIRSVKEALDRGEEPARIQSWTM